MVHAPALGLTYLAVRGSGAIRIRKTPLGDKREKIMPSTTPSLDYAVVSFGMSHVPEESKRALESGVAYLRPSGRHQARWPLLLGFVQGGGRYI